MESTAYQEFMEGNVEEKQITWGNNSEQDPGLNAQSQIDGIEKSNNTNDYLEGNTKDQEDKLSEKNQEIKNAKTDIKNLEEGLHQKDVRLCQEGQVIPLCLYWA